ncbi:MAG: cyclase family protein [Thermoplasmata archaeon]|nr:cyclase family protein [Candidatus Sysuiplasma jiujiangense]
MNDISSRIIDISAAVSERIPIYEGNPPLSMTWAMSLASGDGVNLTEIHEGVHTGTHIDAPLHFIKGGSTIDLVPPKHFFCNVQVVETRGRTVRPAALKGKAIRDGDGVLFKTSNSLLYDRKFTRNFVYLEAETAERLVEMRVPVVGIDYLSVEKFGSAAAPVHHTLLREGIPIIEGLTLKGVKPGRYTLSAMPVKLKGREAAPARAVLFDPPLADVINIR